MASAATSSLTFLDQRGHPLDAPREWEPGLVAIDAPPSSWEHLALTCNDRPLDVQLRHIAGASRVVAEWPRSGTGHYRLRVTTPNATEDLTTSVWPRKISKAGYFQVLDDLDQLPASIAISAQRAGALSGVKLPPPSQTTLAAEVLRLRRAIEGTPERPGLEKVLRAIAADPHLVLQTSDVWLPRDQVRRVHPTRLAQAIATVKVVDESGMPSRLPNMRVEHTADVYENRLLRTFHDQVSGRLRRLRARLSNGENQGLIDELDQLARSLHAARREAAFLDEVSTPRQLPTQLTMVLLRRAPYRAALQGYVEFRRTVSIRLEEPALDAPLEHLPYLYEKWATLQVINATVTVAAELGYTLTERIFNRDQSGLYLHVLRNGRAALILRHQPSGTTVKLIPQRAYGPHGTPLRSASYEQKPDIAIEIERPGRPTRLLIFDPKYKLRSEELESEITDGKPQKPDIDKMHAYRDAIRDQNDRHVVEYAAIIYPGAASERFGAGLEAFAARPGESSAYQEVIRAVLVEELPADVSVGLATQGI